MHIVALGAAIPGDDVGSIRTTTAFPIRAHQRDRGILKRPDHEHCAGCSGIHVVREPWRRAGSL